MWDQPGVHDIYRRWRQIADEYARPGEDADRILCAEAWVKPADALARYVRGDELHQSFNFEFLMTPWLAGDLRPAISQTLRAAEAVGAPQTWVLSNHDVVRHATRLGVRAVARLEAAARHRRRRPAAGRRPRPSSSSRSHDSHARAARVRVSVPGRGARASGGDPTSRRRRQDPTWERSAHTLRGRDGCRVPMPWEGSTPSLGFGPGAECGCRNRRSTERSPSTGSVRQGLDPRALPAAPLAPARAAARPWLSDLVRLGPTTSWRSRRRPPTAARCW